MKHAIAAVGRWAGVLALAWGMLPGPAGAGQGTYDKAKRAFHLNYIYAALPSNELNEQQVLASRSDVRPTAEQANEVNVFLKRVSDLFSRVTDGRAAIDQITEVLDIEKA